jgi:lipooligosaccharide transport system permease protein
MRRLTAYPGADAARPTPLLRILPVHLYAGRAHVLMERSVRAYRRSWMVIASGFFEPLFYLFAMGNGLGSLIGPVSTAAGPVQYAAYIAPALLATSAMNGAILDSTNNVFFKMKHAKLYDGMLATSLGPVDVALGEIIWSLVRGGLYSGTFVLVMLGLGLLTSWWALLAVPLALVIAFGFAAVGMAITSYMKTFQHLEWVNIALLPMFLFSTTFYPLGVYPRPIQLLVECLPLYHGIELMRGLCLGLVTSGLFLHVFYFLAMIGAGLLVTSRRLEKLLLR